MLLQCGKEVGREPNVNRSQHRYARLAAYSESVDSTRTVEIRRSSGAATVWTQRDQIQAYQFLRRRLISALVAADSNHPTSPSRRLVLGTILGIAGAVLITAAFGVIGLLNPSGAADWQQGGQVILEQETGARYVLGQDGLLHPVLNYASARLLAGGNGSNTVTVSANTLGSASRGAMLGIPGAPDSLPAAGFACRQRVHQLHPHAARSARRRGDRWPP